MEQASSEALSGLALILPGYATTLYTHLTKSFQQLIVVDVFWGGQAQLFGFRTVLENWKQIIVLGV